MLNSDNKNNTVHVKVLFVSFYYICFYMVPYKCFVIRSFGKLFLKFPNVAGLKTYKIIHLNTLMCYKIISMKRMELIKDNESRK